ncbi:alpha/beta hydrolase [Gordonia sp. X0973]|uniref:alpha/beta fold hydrolase n=1 Tax=Gordonia sp. X0973 TaxID=2742602 RepID=UPI000F5205CF|nr:alpha/beta hydrolase [Gordonia sp. X0973]QKT06248.1 alpha/beta hydrolase [Gordonia sp. X0973]
MSSTRVSVPSGDVTIIGDRFGDPADPPILFLHGGGQTRHSWANSARRLAEAGWSTLTVDLRGHGESGWSRGGEYGLNRFAADITAVAQWLPEPPVLVGASLGGNAALSALGDNAELARALVLVDVSPFIQSSGRDRVRAFMAANAETGFASLEEAGDAVAEYQPHRKRPKNLDGLRKNLRERDGRWYWHWDPAFITGLGSDAVQRDRILDPVHLGAAAASLRVPTLLIRGGESDVISAEDSARFLHVVPHAEFASVGGAHHMVAGDDNAVFEDVLADFLDRRVRSRLDLFAAVAD